jgi:hypothetical protein
MPFPKAYRTMKIQGRYPNARYFSIVAYSGDANGRPVDTSGSRHDATIAPDRAGADAYTVRVSRDAAVSGAANGIPVTANDAWVMLRIYGPAPDASLSGLALSGGVPLPVISFDDDTPRGRLWFTPPRVPPMLLLPNPDNKYIMSAPGPYQSGRVVVIRARAPQTPDGPRGGGPGMRRGARGEDVRYWSLCNNDFALPVPAVRCVSDLTARIEGGWFTVVISDDLTRPEWLRPGVNWLPWGDEQYPKLVFFRHLLATDSFPHSIQQVVKGCPSSCVHPDAVFDLVLPDVPRRSVIQAPGPAVQRVMGDYYPVAAWCDKSTFERGGWQACLGRP